MNDTIFKNGSFPWPCDQCQDCQRQKECPYVYDQRLRHTARQGKAEAQRLTAEAERFLESISTSNDVRCLLDGSKDLEQALTRGLSAEMTMIDSLRTQRAKYCQ